MISYWTDCSLLHLTVNSDTVPTHVDVVLSFSELLPPFSLRGFFFSGFLLTPSPLSQSLATSLPVPHLLLSTTQVSSRCRGCSTFRWPVSEKSSLLSCKPVFSVPSSPGPLRFSVLMFFVRVVSVPSIPFPSCPEKIPFRPHFTVNIQTRSGSELKTHQPDTKGKVQPNYKQFCGSLTL